MGKRITATLTSIRLDTQLANEAAQVLGAKNRTEVVHMALREVVALKRFKELMKNYAGKLSFRDSKARAQTPRFLSILFSLALVLVLLWPGTAAPQAPGGGGQANLSISVEENVLYAMVNGSQLHLDVYKPAQSGSAPRPAVILIHGGGWTGLDKSTMRAMGNFLAGFGLVAFSVDYRLFHAGENPWPAQLDDVQRAVRWVRANAEKYGVNPERLGAFGHSAGAQLAALLGMEDTRDNSDPALAKYSSRVQAVVDVSGPTDFTAQRDPDDVAFLTSFLGADYSTHPEIWRDASPAYRVSKQDAPFLIVHGTGDEAVPMAQAQELFEKLQAAGVPVKFVKVDDAHTFRTPEARRQLAIETLAFFHRNLAPLP